MNPEKLKQLQEQVRIGGKVKSLNMQKKKHVFIRQDNFEYSINFSHSAKSIYIFLDKGEFEVLSTATFVGGAYKKNPR